tara:strand:- start:139 stop:1236 length:1098 start_codon:yes stop_codon:yes gene_type:complete
MPTNEKYQRQFRVLQALKQSDIVVKNGAPRLEDLKNSTPELRIINNTLFMFIKIDNDIHRIKFDKNITLNSSGGLGNSNGNVDDSLGGPQSIIPNSDLLVFRPHNNNNTFVFENNIFDGNDIPETNVALSLSAEQERSEFNSKSPVNYFVLQELQIVETNNESWNGGTYFLYAHNNEKKFIDRENNLFPEVFSVKNDGTIKTIGKINSSDTVTSTHGVCGGTRHFIHAGFNYGYTAGTKIYVPMIGTFESSSGASRNETLTFVAPYDGYLNQVIFRSEEACGSTIVGLHKSATGTEIPNTTAAMLSTVNMAADDTPYRFGLGQGVSSGANTFDAGDILAISFDPTNDANDTVCTIELIFDINEGL